MEIESDRVPVIEATKLLYYGADAATIAECAQLATGFGKVCFGYCSRDANAVADCLAKSVV